MNNPSQEVINYLHCIGKINTNSFIGILMENDRALIRAKYDPTIKYDTSVFRVDGIFKTSLRGFKYTCPIIAYGIGSIRRLYCNYYNVIIVGTTTLPLKSLVNGTSKSRN